MMMERLNCDETTIDVNWEYNTDVDRTGPGAGTATVESGLGTLNNE